MMLDSLLNKLIEGQIVPRKIYTPIKTVQSYGNFGSHDQEDEYEEIDADFALPSYNALETIMTWFRDQNSEIEYVMTRGIEELPLSKRSNKMLRRSGITSIAELCHMTENDLLRIKGCGRRTIYEIKEVLAEKSLGLGMRFDLRLIKEMSNNQLERILDSLGNSKDALR